MTLAITIVAPWNIWQCSDFRVVHLRPRPNGQSEVTRTEDRSVKFVQLRCRDGAAHLAYSGLAMVGNDQVSDWVRRQVRGYSRTVDGTLIRIREAATAELAGLAKATGVVHAFAVGAYVQRCPWAVAITNTTGPPAFRILDRFETAAVRADEPKVMVIGEGQNAISGEDRALLLRVAQRRPKRPEDYSRLLANIHHRARHSKHRARHMISEACITSYMPPSGDGGRAQTHWDNPNPSTWPPSPPMVLDGIDMTDTERVMVEMLMAAEAGQPIDDAEFKRRVDEAGLHSVEPPKP